MVTPGSLGPPPTDPTDGEQIGQPLLDGAPSSASLDTLIQHLVPTTDYYPEVGYPSNGEEGHQSGLPSTTHGGDARAGAGLGPEGTALPCPCEHMLPFSVSLSESLHLHLPSKLPPLHRAPGAPGPGLPPVY